MWHTCKVGSTAFSGARTTFFYALNHAGSWKPFCKGGSNTFEFIPIYASQCLRGKEAPALAGGPCTGLPSFPPVFLALTSVTVGKLQRLIPSFEAALQAQMACDHARHPVRMHLTRSPLTM
jgi:hypothetical protein